MLICAALMTALSRAGAGRVHFDYNLLNLQARGTESVVWERRILATSGARASPRWRAPPRWTSCGRSAAFRRLQDVSEVDSALLLIPDQQAEKRKIIADFAPIVAPVRLGAVTPVDSTGWSARWTRCSGASTIAGGEAPAGDAQRELVRTAEDIGRLVVKLRQTDRDEPRAALTLLQRQIYRDFVTQLPAPAGQPRTPARSAWPTCRPRSGASS